MSINDSKPESRTNDIVVQELEGEVLVYDLIKNKAFCLNKTSAIIWQNCNGQRTIEEIAEYTGKELESLISKETIQLALEQFRTDDLLKSNNRIENYLDGLSRREIIKRVGLSSLVALPLVSSLVAPKVTTAQSMCAMAPLANGCPCMTQGSCASGCCGPTSNGCITPGSLNIGDACRANCNCPGNCCGNGNVCATVGGTAQSGACRVNCECTAGTTCVGGTCQLISP